LNYLKTALFLVLAVAGILFGISNQDNATVHFFWYFTKTFPLYLILFACFLAGTLTAILFGSISGSQRKDEERRMGRHRDELREKLSKIQATNVSSDHPGISDGSSG
jgi:uncharacterized integral membrane protein